ncbi:LCR [Medicago truncatula]|uniref:LCR n=1 Tax=Medicago truncatula TaxID=3880 RepID=A0A072US34_MEDTR|nr:LCR [Medicago truncatula]
MAFETNQSYLLGVLCIVLIFGSGFITSSADLPSRKNCTIPCTATCDKDCHDKGFQKSGQCIGNILLNGCCCLS